MTWDEDEWTARVRVFNEQALASWGDATPPWEEVTLTPEEVTAGLALGISYAQAQRAHSAPVVKRRLPWLAWFRLYFGWWRDSRREAKRMRPALEAHRAYVQHRLEAEAREKLEARSVDLQ